MTVHRQIQALLLLQSRRRVTAAEVAAELEVSPRTARRVLESLGVAGLPVYSTAGRGGGWSILGDARTDLTGLSDAEARALFLVAGPSASVSDDVRRALRKLVQALPADQRVAAEAATERLHVDPRRWGTSADTTPAEPERVLADAVLDGAQVLLDYRDQRGRTTSRVVEPLGLVDVRGVGYAVADTPSGRRSFRVDRIVAAERTGATFDRPDGFDLATEWASMRDAFEATFGDLEVTAVVDRSALALVTGVIGDVDTDETSPDDARVEVRMRFRSRAAAVGVLAGFADVVEVLAPADVVAGLAEAGRTLVARYA